MGDKMKTSSLSNTVLMGLAALSWSATAIGFYKMVVGDSTGAGAVAIGVLAAVLSGMIQGLMILFFKRATQPKQISPTRWLFGAGAAITMAASVTLGYSTYADILNVRSAVIAEHVATDQREVDGAINAILANTDAFIAALSGVKQQVDSVAAAELVDGPGPKSAKYEGRAEVIGTTLSSIQSVRTEIAAIWVAAQSEADPARLSKSMRDALSAAEAKVNTIPAKSLASTAQSEIDYVTKEWNNGSLGNRQRVASFVSAMEALRDAANGFEVPQSTQLRAAPDTGAAADVAAAMATLGKLAKGDPLTSQEKMIFALALMVDAFIILVMIWQVQEQGRTNVTISSIKAMYKKALPEMDHLVRNAGYEDISEAVNAIESNGKAVLGVPDFFGHVVWVPVPKTANKLNDLMVNLKNLGMAWTLPVRVTETADGDVETKEKRGYWVPGSRWIELQSMKTVVVTSPKLSSTMTFGEFVDWVLELPDAERLIGDSKKVRSIIARNFPHAWPMKLKDFSHASVQEHIDHFGRVSKVTERTKAAYERTFTDMVALAAHKGLLPTERPVRSLSVAA